MSLDDEVYSQPVQRKTRLITRPDERHPFTATRETDVRTAALRGLRDYLEGLSYAAPGGARLRFLKVEEAWPEPDQSAKYPAANIYTDEAGTYDGAGFTPRVAQLPDGRVIQIASEFVQNVTVDLWCTNAAERMGLLAMLEDAFDPVDWMSGFRLHLPHYYGVVASYLKTSVSAIDSTENANRRWRLASMTLTVNLPQIRLVGALPGLDIRLRVETLEPDMAGVLTPPIEGVTAVDLVSLAVVGG